MGIHWQELVIILVIALVIFGPRRLPEIGRSMGSGIREFRDSFSGARKEPGLDEQAPTPGSQPAAATAAALPVEVERPAADR